MALHAEFHFHPVLQAEESQKAERQIFKDEIYVRIHIKGNRNQILDRKMREADKLDFPEAWKNFQLNGKSQAHGTPLSHLPRMSPSMIAELNAVHIKTVEDLAELDDAAIGNIQGGRTLKTLAKNYLSLADTSLPTIKPINTQRADPVDVDELQGMPGVIARPSRGPGRPKRVVEELSSDA